MPVLDVDLSQKSVMKAGVGSQGKARGQPGQSQRKARVKPEESQGKAEGNPG